MNVQKNETTFPFPVLLLQGSHTPDAGITPQVGALIAKQSVAFDAAGVQQPPVAADIRLTDELYGSGQAKLEADVVVYKPRLDMVVVDASFIQLPVHFSWVTITRGGVSGSPLHLHYGWQPRAESPRVSLAGKTDPGPPGQPPVLRFVPDDKKPFKLPEEFKSEFFNGHNTLLGKFGGVLAAGDKARFHKTLSPQADDITLTIPPGPALKFTQDCWGIAPPQWVSRGVDTIVFLAAERCILLTWRFVFTWEARLQLATLEVS